MPSSLPLFSPPRSSLYRYTQSQVQFNAYVQAETLLNNYAHILDLLTRLRQAIDHPYLVLHSPRGIEVDDAPPVPVGGGVCGLCYEDAVAPVTTACGHGFCRECMQNYVESLAAEARAARRNPTPEPKPEPKPYP